jgi:hypothetical protein
MCRVIAGLRPWHINFHLHLLPHRVELRVGDAGGDDVRAILDAARTMEAEP